MKCKFTIQCADCQHVLIIDSDTKNHTSWNTSNDEPEIPYQHTDCPICKKTSMWVCYCVVDPSEMTNNQV